MPMMGMKFSGRYNKERMRLSIVELFEVKEVRLLIPTNPPRRARMLPPRAGRSSRPPETRVSCPFRMSVASNASSVTDDVDDDCRCPSPKNMFRDAKKLVIADASLMTSKAADTGATSGPDVNASRVICGM